MDNDSTGYSYDDSAEYRNDGGGKPKARRANPKGMTLAWKRRERTKLIEVATQIFCANISIDNNPGKRLSITESVDRAAILMLMATDKVEEWYGEKASKELP